ncbi:DUF6452 family protein [Flavobacterium sp.]
MKKIIALLFIVMGLSGCEKDDICTDETTPRLIVEFYDISNNANLKNVLDLKVKAEVLPGETDPGFIVFDPSLEVDDPERYLFNGNKIELPLRINGATTKYRLILNSESANPDTDFLQFNYTAENVFVSRACGYKTIFTLNNADGVIKSDAGTPESFWITDFNILTTNIETENETHLKIYF